MKNLRFIILCLFLIQNYIQSSDPGIIGYYIDDTSEPNTRIVYRITKNEVPDQELSRKTDPETGRTIIHRLTSNPHYQPKAIPEELDFSNIKFGTLKTRDDHVDPELLEREENFKEFRQQKKATTKIQTELRSRQAHEKIREAKAAKIRQAEADEKNQAELRSKEYRLFLDVVRNKLRLTVKIRTLADQSYQRFKELICTSDYLTKTDWLYQFIEAAEKKTIFERNSDGTINPEKFTPEFEKEIKNPSDWLDDKIAKYLPGFHDLVYETFINKAAEQIIKHRRTWADAVSIPTPKGHGSFQEEGTPLFPKIYKSPYVVPSDNELILGKIFIEILGQDHSLEEDPKNFEAFPFQDFIKFEKSSNSDFLNVWIFDHLASSVPNKPSSLLKETQDPYLYSLVLNRFYDYLKTLGVELSPENNQKLDKYYQDLDKSTSNSKQESLEKIDRISNAKAKFLKDHINFASSARQTFYLGQLIFDKNLTALDALGGQKWLEKQPRDMQKYISNKLKNSPKLH
jgi:hypothetical protein